MHHWCNTLNTEVSLIVWRSNESSCKDEMQNPVVVIGYFQQLSNYHSIVIPNNHKRSCIHGGMQIVSAPHMAVTLESGQDKFYFLYLQSGFHIIKEALCSGHASQSSPSGNCHGNKKGWQFVCAHVSACARGGGVTMAKQESSGCV